MEIQCGDGPQQPVTEAARPRPGWVHDIVVAVLAAASQPLRPQEVIRLAERVHERRIAPSSVRNCLREASARDDSPIRRLEYGRYEIRKKS